MFKWSSTCYWLDKDGVCAGKTICTGSQDGSFRVWNPKTGESVRVVQGQKSVDDLMSSNL
jgi:WD40 repeat protein